MPIEKGDRFIFFSVTPTATSPPGPRMHGVSSRIVTFIQSMPPGRIATEKSPNVLEYIWQQSGGSFYQGCYNTRTDPYPLVVKCCHELEDYLDEHNYSWVQLSDSEYRNLIKEWRKIFEPLLIEGYSRVHGDMAVSNLISRLGSGMYVFNVPNYKYLPVTPSQQDPTYGYHVERLDSIKRELFDRIEAVICDDKMAFMCAFNHEGQSLVPEVFYEIG